MEKGTTAQAHDFIDQKGIADMLSVKPKSIYYIMESDNSFPKPIQLSPRIKRWKRDDVVAWLDAKISQR